MHAGPKRKVTAQPLDLSALPAPGWRRVDAFSREYLKVPKGKGAKQPFRLRPWQKNIVKALYPARGRRPRQGLVSLPRGNGKSALAAVLGLYGLFADDTEGAQVLCVASDERQARIIFNAARRMVELEPRLAEQVQVFQDRLYVPHTDSVLMPLPADEGALQGWDPSLAIVDELHVVSEATYDAMQLASGKRESSLLLSISTPADSTDSVMWKLVDYGRQHPEDPSFVLCEYGAPDGCATDDEDAWKQANPALDDFLARDAIRATLRTTREPAFRRYRLGQWAAASDTWLPWGAWEDRADRARQVKRGERVVLAFDGSASGDSTALVGCTLDGHVFVVDVWEHPADDPRWRVPRHLVDAAVENAFAAYDVAEFAADPWGWRSEIEAWSARFGAKRVLEWNTAHAARMAPATDRLYAAVNEETVTHDGDTRLASHIGHCVAKATPMGDLVSKDKKSSPRKIDAAVAAIVAFDRASWHANKKSARKVVTFR